ncbi:hypothetical protein [Leptolyngbya sp. BC1307]|uniref:hypothetical protein n=1 Tax=Leptolyngbya sp. BC1307 TaxID=2029589 RepID=UPI000EFBB2AB|nr:hypothetical protein [Leptolyngbya sp. BC1307]
MKLSPADVDLFMKLTLQLQWYAQKQGQVLPKVKSFAAYTTTSMREKVEVRDYLFNHSELIDQFIQENPADFTQEELAIVSGWKTFVKDKFYVERLLKKHGIFIDSKENVYGISGLSDELSDMIDRRNLPLCAQAVLLPFKGRIVHDGLLGFYNVSFGSGIRSSLKEIYLIAKDNDAIIETLDPSFDSAKAKKAPAKAAQDWTLLLDEMTSIAKKLRGGSGQPALYSPIFSLVRASVELAQSATEEPPDMDKLAKKARRIDTLLDQLDRTIGRDY